MNLSTKYVRPEGGKNARIMVVGEAPGEDEEKDSRPFVGRSGQFMERYYGRCGVHRSDLYLTNLCRYRPKWNNFRYCLGTTQLEEGLEQLKEEIRIVKPNVIVAMGAWPMYYLTGCMASKKNAKPGDGISLWRGSIMPCTLVEGFKVAISLHPAYVIRPQGFQMHPVFFLDVKKSVKNSLYPEIRYPQYEEIIDPDAERLGTLVEELCRAEWLSVDIETAGPQLTCIGFTDSVNRGLCLSFIGGASNWEAAQAILASPAKKIFQYGHYDVNYLKWYYGWPVRRYAFDTYVAANSLFFGFPKTLQFLTSIYTDFPYYKEDRKSWKATMNIKKLWQYNLKDVLATYMIAMQQMDELGWRP